MNDTPGTAELLPVGDYWGIVSGTTVGASPVSGTYYAWYYWDDLPAGMVYVFVRPTTATYTEAYLIEGMPNLHGPAPIAYATFDPANPPDRGVCQGVHTGGPLAMYVATYDPDQAAFDLGWGHELDADPAHWDMTTRTNPMQSIAFSPPPTLSASQLSLTFYTNSVPVYSPTSASNQLAPDQSLVDCGFDNARRGVTKAEWTGAFPAPSGCSPQPDGPGAPGAATQKGNVGTMLLTTSAPASGGPYQREDKCAVDESILRLTFSPLKLDETPATWGSHADPDFNWGWRYLATKAIEGDVTLVVNVGDFTVKASGSFTQVLNESCRPALVLLPTSLTTAACPFVPLYKLPAPVAVLDDQIGVTTVSFADWLDSYQDSASAINIACVSREALDNQNPTPQLVTSGNDFFCWRERAVRYSGSYRRQQPAYCIYRGFPLTAPPVGGWHIGRTGAGVSW